MVVGKKRGTSGAAYLSMDREELEGYGTFFDELCLVMTVA